MRKYPNIKEIQNKIASNGVAHLSFYANEKSDIIHPYSIPGYEYLSGGFVEFLDRFKGVIPKKMPIVLKIEGKQFDPDEKEMIDNAVWTHYGLYLSEAAIKLKKTRLKVILYLLLMILSSSLLFLVANLSSEVAVNYGYLLFWFFAYRLLTHLLLDCIPIYREYHWYRRLASLKLIFSAEASQALDIEQLSKETSGYKREADRLVIKHTLVDQVFMDDSIISLGCRISKTEDVLCPSGANDLEIISPEMADYLMSALPFIKKNKLTKLEIEGGDFTETEQDRISDAIRNHLAFCISDHDKKKKDNINTIFLFGVCLFVSTVILYAWGKSVNVAVHEFLLVLFWFFGDYLLEFILLSRLEINNARKLLEKLANMDILYK